MPRSADSNFRPFLLKTGKTRRLTTQQLYELAENRNLSLTRNRKRDANRPTQFAWQHQMRRDQFVLMQQGVYKRYANGTWGTIGS